MKKIRNIDETSSTKRSKPAMTPEQRENQLIALTYDLVEQRIRNGTATSQETTHFLKMGSTKARAEHEKMKEEIQLLKAKTEALESQKRSEELFSEALKAMKSYSGVPDEN